MIHKKKFIVINAYIKWSKSRLVMSDSLWPHRLYSPWNIPGQNTGVGSYPLLQGIFPTRGLNQVSCIAMDSLPTKLWGKPRNAYINKKERSQINYNSRNLEKKLSQGKQREENNRSEEKWNRNHRKNRFKTKLILKKIGKPLAGQIKNRRE